MNRDFSRKNSWTNFDNLSRWPETLSHSEDSTELVVDEKFEPQPGMNKLFINERKLQRLNHAIGTDALLLTQNFRENSDPFETGLFIYGEDAKNSLGRLDINMPDANRFRLEAIESGADNAEFWRQRLNELLFRGYEEMFHSEVENNKIAFSRKLLAAAALLSVSESAGLVALQIHDNDDRQDPRAWVGPY